MTTSDDVINGKKGDEKDNNYYVDDGENDLLEQIIVDELAIFSLVAMLVQTFMWSSWIGLRFKPWLTVNIFGLDASDYDSSAGKFEELIWPELLVCFLISTFFNVIHAPSTRLYQYLRRKYRSCRSNGCPVGKRAKPMNPYMDNTTYSFVRSRTAGAPSSRAFGLRTGFASTPTTTTTTGASSSRVVATIGGMLAGMSMDGASHASHAVVLDALGATTGDGGGGEGFGHAWR